MAEVARITWVQFDTAASAVAAVPVFLYHYVTQERTEMAQLLKQSTAYTFQLGPFVDSTDGVTPETGLTIAATDVDVSKNGGAFADKNDATALTGTGDSQGYYDCMLDATDTATLGKLDVRCYVSGALPVLRAFQVVPAHVYDGLVAGSDNLQVDTVQVGGTVQTARDIGASVLLSSGTGTGQVSLTSGRVNADVTHIATAAVSTSTAQLGVNVAKVNGVAVDGSGTTLDPWGPA